MSERKGNTEEQNEFAENVKGEVIYILDAESGRKGYFCIGCKTQMQAVRTKIKGRKSYFRHDATDVKKIRGNVLLVMKIIAIVKLFQYLTELEELKYQLFINILPKIPTEKLLKLEIPNL
ncbi:hypothetical protein OEG92_05220 [Polaribacter sejongensis]|uniref:hypothetical protein n=1 Tax=Polaribacter sejongensis TaxID=985043 RepID=UPI0035A585F5